VTISVHALQLMAGRHFAMPLRCVKTGLFAVRSCKLICTDFLCTLIVKKMSGY